MLSINGFLASLEQAEHAAATSIKSTKVHYPSHSTREHTSTVLEVSFDIVKYCCEKRKRTKGEMGGGSQGDKDREAFK